MKLYYLLILLLTFSCSKIPTDEYKEFKIKNHYSKNRVKTKLKEPFIQGHFKLDFSCEYELTKNIGQINKLIGIGFDNNHHQNSIRIGWEWEKDHYKMWAYYYINGNRGSEYITNCTSNIEYYFRVESRLNKYIVTVDNKTMFIPGQMSINKPRLLLPYFGGKEPFPGSIYNDDECSIFIKFI